VISPERLAERRAAFVDDVEFLVEQGMDMREACRRLGRSRKRVVIRLTEAGRVDLIQQLDPKFRPTEPLVDAEAVRAHLRSLREQGWTRAGIAMACGLGKQTLDDAARGTYAGVRESTAKAILAITGPPAEKRRTGREASGFNPGWAREPSESRRAA
jgi:hypothetical protein